MKTWEAIVFSVGLLGACIVASSWIGFNLTWIMVFGTAIWAAFDSSKIQLKRYESGISYGPVVLFIACSMLWIVGFPWYLAMRHKIRSGAAVLKPEFAEPGAAANSGPAAPRGGSGAPEGPRSVS